MTILTDAHPGETMWTIVKEDGGLKEIVASGGPYQKSMTSYEHSHTVAAGSYSFVIRDSAGNGLCCQAGAGHFEVLMDKRAAASGSIFADRLEIPFVAAESPPAPPFPPTAYDLVTTVEIAASLLTATSSAQLSQAVVGAMVSVVEAGTTVEVELMQKSSFVAKVRVRGRGRVRVKVRVRGRHDGRGRAPVKVQLRRQGQG